MQDLLRSFGSGLHPNRVQRRVWRTFLQEMHARVAAEKPESVPYLQKTVQTEEESQLQAETGDWGNSVAMWLLQHVV